MGKPVGGRVPPSAPSQFLKGFRFPAEAPFFVISGRLADLWLAGPNSPVQNTACEPNEGGVAPSVYEISVPIISSTYDLWFDVMFLRRIVHRDRVLIDRDPRRIGLNR